MKLLDSLHRISIPHRSEPIHTLLKEVTHIRGFVEKATIPSIVPTLMKALNKCRSIRMEVRESATRYIQPKAVQYALRSGKIFITSLFDPVAMTKAEELALPFTGNSLQGI